MLNNQELNSKYKSFRDRLNEILIGILLFNPFLLYLLIGKFLVSIACFLLLQVLNFVLFSLIKEKSKVLFIYLFNILIIISIFFHFEVIFRYKFPQYNIENLYTAKRKFYINKKNLLKNIEDKEYSCIYKTNCQGIRIPESYNTLDSINSCDWLVIGDSYTQGAQVNFDQLYTSHLYKEFPDKTILNYGISGLGLPEELELFKFLYPRFKPSKLILQVCNFNDFMNVKLSNIGYQNRLVEISDLYRFFYFNMMYKSPGELPIGRWTEPFSPSIQENIDKNIFYKKSSKIKEEDISEFKKYLSEINKATKDRNVELIVVLIPTKEQVYYKFFEEVVNSYKINVEELDMTIPNKITKKLCDSLDIKLIDLYDAYTLAPNQVFFDFDEHLNAFGHIITAYTIRDSLIKWGEYSESKIFSKSLYGERYGNPSYHGDLIISQAIIDGNMELFIADSSNLERTRLTINNVDDLHPTFNHENNKVIYTEGDYQDSKSEVVCLNLNDYNKVEISNRVNEFGAIPSISSNDSLIAYSSWYILDKKITKPQIVIHFNENGQKRNITNNEYDNWRPSFSPDNRYLTYISKRSWYHSLMLYDLKDESEIVLLDLANDIWDPSFSKNGDKIIFAANIKDNWDLFEYNLVSKKVLQITSSKGDEWDPFYLSDQEIMYSGSFGPFRCIYTKKSNGIPVF